MRPPTQRGPVTVLSAPPPGATLTRLPLIRATFESIQPTTPPVVLPPLTLPAADSAEGAPVMP